MCGRFSLSKTREALARDLGVAPEQVPEDLQSRFNIAPTDPHLIVIQEREDRVLRRARWGLVNSWAKDGRGAARHINARAESLDSSPAFRAAFRSRRCLVPVDGFYEWFGPKADRQPYWFHRSDARMICFAGLYEFWYPLGEEPQVTFTIVTTGANSYVGRIHDRMPVVLDEAAQDEWLYPDAADLPRLKALLVPAADDALVAVPVSKEVNNVRNDSPSLRSTLTLAGSIY